MDSIIELWKAYNQTSNNLSNALGRTNNVVGEFAEYLSFKLIGGQLLRISKSSADIMDENGIKYQVKSRKLPKLKSTQLNVIRSWDFDFLIVIIFNSEGEILKGVQLPVEVAKKHAKWNGYQKGGIISTNKEFLNDMDVKDITDQLNQVLVSHLQISNN